MKGLSLVIPCYNETAAIYDTLLEVREAFKGVDKSEYEVVCVNDGSSDDTGDLLEKYKDEFGIKVVHHSVNRGYGAALKTGIASTEKSHIVITDADGTYPNERIMELYYECLEGNYDMVIGARTAKDVTYSKIRKIPKFFLKAWINQIAGQEIPDFNSGLRVFKREKALKYFPILPNSFSFTTTITLSMHTNWERVKYTPISYQMRVGNSKIKPIQDTLRFSMLIARTGMYFNPLRLLLPPIAVVFVLFMISLIADTSAGNITDKTVVLFSLSTNLTVFALLADMINKRGLMSRSGNK
jgi:glycosyltransferase involved in cell wall biosynthesis